MPQCETATSVPERLMQSHDPASLPLRDDRRIARAVGDGQPHLSPTFWSRFVLFHKASPILTGFRLAGLGDRLCCRGSMGPALS